MTYSTPASSDHHPATRQFLPWLVLLFVGSGCAALIYEIVWFQMLQLVIGSTAVSLGVLLGTFMGGMCLGSLLLPRLLSRKLRPLRVYAMLEGGIGVIGLLVLFGMPVAEKFYLSVAGVGMSGITLRGLVCVACLLPPTLLMGATLPAISRWLETTSDGVSWLGFFYGGNIAGAVCGCLLAGFYLLPMHDMAVATYVAVLINFTVATLGFGMDAMVGTSDAQSRESTGPVQAAPGAKLIYVTIALSGMSALGAEVVWTRLMSLIIGGTVYAFSVILAVFLIGLGLGSTAGSMLSRAKVRSRLTLGICQMLLAASIGWTAFMLTQSMPFWPIDPSLTDNAWLTFQVDMVRSLWAILPPTLLWGASFPLALAGVAAPGQDPGKLVGGVYAANTVGAIVGSLLFSLVIIPQFGTQGAQRCLVGLAVTAALIMLVPLLGLAGSTANAGAGKTAPPSNPTGPLAALSATTTFVLFLAMQVGALPAGLVFYGRMLPTYKELPQALYVGEGLNSTVAVSEDSSGLRNFHVSGKVEASTEPQDMRLQRMLGHIPALMINEPKSVLIVGCGAGVTAGTFLNYPSITRIVICELEPLIPQFVTPYFSEQNYGIVDNLAKGNPQTINGKTVEVIYDDGRHFMQTTKEKFDIITSDPIHPWVKGSATLYTKDYFETEKQHLNPGGMITQWVPLYESNTAAVQSELKTFFAVFPEGTVWSNDTGGAGYDVVMLGMASPAPINVDTLQERLDRPEYGPVVRSLQNVGFSDAVDLLKTYAGQGPDFAPWLINAETNTDLNLRLQYIAGHGANLQDAGGIYNQMKPFRSAPEHIFTGASPALNRLLNALPPGK